MSSRKRRPPQDRGSRPPSTEAGAPVAEKPAPKTPPPRAKTPRTGVKKQPDGGAGEVDQTRQTDGSARQADGAKPRRRRRPSQRRRAPQTGDSGQRREPSVEPAKQKEIKAPAKSKATEQNGGAAGDGAGDGSRRPRRRRRGRRRSEPQKPAPSRTMVVSVGKERNQIAILDSRTLVEHYVAHREARSIVGNVYVGKVHNVLPGMEAAFIDIGEDRNAVLYAGEVGFDEDVDVASRRIETVLKNGQSLMAQVTKDPMGSKGARLTTQTSLAGRYLVLVPEGEGVGISRRLGDEERRRLRDIASGLDLEGYGLIVRTAADGASADELKEDLRRLTETWKAIQRDAAKAKAPSLINEEPELVIRVVRDLFTDEVGRLVVDDSDVFGRIKEYVEDVTPELADRIELHAEDLPVFERFHVIEQLRKALDRKVWLPSGGHIVIDRTEAMTVIDVNTGRFVGKSTLEDTVSKTNLEAAQEIAKQLKLRDIGGIIVIDFIDLMEEANRDELLRMFREALSTDKAKTQVFDISELGIVQMTRKRVSEGLLEAFSEICQQCQGRGVILGDLD